MEKYSNIQFTSNIYPIKDDYEPRANKEFISKVFDYGKLKAMNETWLAAPADKYLLSRLQNAILAQGVLCSNAEGDPCWGLIKQGDEESWICKCLKKNCSNFLNCRKTFDESEYKLFSRDYNKWVQDYYYEGAEIIVKPTGEKQIKAPNPKEDVLKPVAPKIEAERIEVLKIEEALKPKNHKPGTTITDTLKSAKNTMNVLKQVKEHIDNSEAGKYFSIKKENDNSNNNNSNQYFVYYKEKKILHITPNLVSIKPKDAKKLNVPFEEQRYNHALKARLLETAYEDTETFLNELFALYQTLEKTGHEPIVTKQTNEAGGGNNLFDSLIPVRQEKIIQADPNEVIFVDAGPGTGKTYTLIEKINYMVSKLDVEAENIIVLSFTNAAVVELKNRLNDFVKADGDRSLRNVDIRTFHSLAWWLLLQANEDDDLISKGWKKINLDSGKINFETSLKCASELLTKYPEFVFGWNLIVDEVQDLTNERAEFVLALINACLINKSCVTVFGDYCQAIYDYSVDGVAPTISSEDFYSKVYQLMNGKGKYYKMGQNYRQTNDLQMINDAFREKILSRNTKIMQAEVGKIKDKIKKMNKTAKNLTEADLHALNDGKPTCLLCRNNGQTLSLSTILHQKKIAHTVNVYEKKENFASWIAQAFFDYKKDTITQEQLNILLNKKKINIEDCSIRELWDQIRGLMHTHGDVVEVQELLDAIRLYRIDDPIFKTIKQEPIIVSNVHRAKGREYESVIIDDAFIEGFQEASNGYQQIGEYKTLYVAMTRPRKNLARALLTESEVVHYPRKKSDQTKRWGRYNNGTFRYLEFLYDNDVDKATFLLDSEVDMSYYKKIKMGDEIKLKRVINNNRVKYEIVHVKDKIETVLGYTTTSFVKEIKRFLYYKVLSLTDMPVSIEDLYVYGVYSHIEDKDYLATHPDAKNKIKRSLWNWVDFGGLGHLIY